MSNFHPIDLHQLSINPFQAIADQWMLITAEKPVDGQPKANTMTASWGGLGHLWGKDVAFAFIRPQRYTKQFVDENDCFSLCFFGGEQMEALRYLGTASGRDEDKIAKSGLTLTHIDSVPCFEEASCMSRPWSRNSSPTGQLPTAATRTTISMTCTLRRFKKRWYDKKADSCTQ